VDRDKLLGGASSVLTKCLAIVDDKPLAIIFDETAEESVNALVEASNLLGITCRSFRVSVEEQRAYVTDHGISHKLGALLDQSRCILTCLSSDEQCTEFRRDVLARAATGRYKRVGHMPGIQAQILASAMDVDYSAIERQCDELALALTVGETARLVSYSADQEPVSLTVGLGAWNRLGVVSSGLIPPGTWGNIPGGESFIAPVEGTANGLFWLNGSFKGVVIPERKALLLTFEHGRLRKFEGDPETRGLFEHLIARARDAGDPNWNQLAELGIGVNAGLALPGRPLLTGNPLSDEKCLGTVHIAIGDNTAFGGVSSSKIHEDLVTVAPTLQIDGKTILEEGHYSFLTAEWKENIETSPADPALARIEQLRVSRGLIPAKQYGGNLRVECAISERLCSYTLGDEATSPILASIYSQVPVDGPEKCETLWSRFRAQHPDIAWQIFAKGVTILVRHRVIVIFPERRHD
jgi:Thermophilic metalloprotease (M29)